METQPQSDPQSSEEKLINMKPPRIPVPKESRNDNVGIAARRFAESSSSLASPQPAASKLDKAIEFELKHGCTLDPNMDLKQLRRTLSNRLSAQKSRLRKAQYIHDMESKVTKLEETVVFLGGKSARFEEKRRLLKLQNEALGELLAIRQNEANQAQLVFERNKEELNRLKALQKAQKMSVGRSSNSCSGFFEDEQDGMDEEDPFLNFDA